MLPAQQGDALWIEYGSTGGSVHRILIDGGTPPTYHVLKQRIMSLSDKDRIFELLIVTHVDADHIGGALKLLADRTLGVTFRDVWFNDFDDLPECPDPTRGPIDGAIMRRVLEGLGIERNRAFGGPAAIPNEGHLPRKPLKDGMVLTLLSPGSRQLAALRCTWSSALHKAGLDPDAPSADELNERARRKGVEIPRSLSPAVMRTLAGARFVRDRARANGSTIAVLAEYEGHSCLLAGDAFAEVLTASVERLCVERGMSHLSVDAFKLPHHGSRRNVSVDMLRVVSSPVYLFSTDGSVFGHPDAEAVARVIAQGTTNRILAFNYRSEPNSIWDDATLMSHHAYEVQYPLDGQTGLGIELGSPAGHRDRFIMHGEGAP
jgi:hypothetical protein